MDVSFCALIVLCVLGQTYCAHMKKLRSSSPKNDDLCVFRTSGMLLSNFREHNTSHNSDREYINQWVYLLLKDRNLENPGDNYRRPTSGAQA